MERMWGIFPFRLQKDRTEPKTTEEERAEHAVSNHN